MGRTIYVLDADDARAALDQIKNEAVADGGEDGGRIAALTGIARVFLDRADKARYRPPQLLQAFHLYHTTCKLISLMLEFDPLALDTLMEALEDAEKAIAVLDRINRKAGARLGNQRAGAKRAARTAAQAASDAVPANQMNEAS
jgi:hypothetical protein